MALSLIIILFRTERSDDIPIPNDNGQEPGMTESILDGYTSMNGPSYGIIDAAGAAGDMVSQSFTGVDAVLSRAQFWMFADSTAVGSLYAHIYAHTGTFGTSSKPTGSPLATSDAINSDSITEDSGGAIITFTFSGANKIQLVAGTKYTVVLDGTSMSAGFVRPLRDNGASTHAGNYALYVSSVWTAYASEDAWFRVYGTGDAVVDTEATTSIGSTRATFNGNLQKTGSSNADERGFVYGLNSQSDPGNVAPEDSGYSFSVSDTGSFGTGTFSEIVTGLQSESDYYVRCFVHNTTGYVYGDQVNASTLNLTTVIFTDTDPTDMVRVALDNYGQSITYTAPSTDDTGLSLPYTFITATILEVFETALSLAPAGWYYYVDLGTNVAYFKQTATTPTHKLIAGRHLKELKLVLSIENVKNMVYFTGGIVGDNNLFKVYIDQDSIDTYGQRIERITHNRVVDVAAADAISESIIQAQKDEKYETEIEVADSTYDITLFKPGDTVGFAGFGGFVDNLILQIVRLEYTPEKATLVVGTLPVRLSSTVEQVKRELLAVQTISNPDTPS